MMGSLNEYLPQGMSVIEPLTERREVEVEKLMWEGGNLRLYKIEDYERLFTSNEIRYFCWKHALYQLPTVELIEHLRLLMIGSKLLPKDVIEIGAGAGQIGRHLGIRMTDSKLQEDPAIIAYYELIRQPLIKYGPDIERIDANSAVEKYRPKMVIACWVTAFPTLEWGVREQELLSQIEQYVFIGNRITHSNKRIIQNHPGEWRDWLVSRSSYPKDNRIWIIKR